MPPATAAAAVRADEGDTARRPRPQVILGRRAKALQPTAHATTQAKKPAPPESKEDPQHPLRGGGPRKRVFAKRPSRVPGSSAWLERQIDRLQRYTLRVAFVLYESSEKRLELCKRFRMTGQQHKHLPLRSMSSKPVCSDSVCSCKPDYIDLVGRTGGRA